MMNNVVLKQQSLTKHFSYQDYMRWGYFIGGGLGVFLAQLLLIAASLVERNFSNTFLIDWTVGLSVSTLMFGGFFGAIGIIVGGATGLLAKLILGNKQ